MLYLDLHLEVCLEVRKESEENGKRQFEDLRHRGDPILGQSHTQVLLDGVYEHLVGLKDGPGVLQDGQQQLEGQDLRPQLVGPETRTEKRKLKSLMKARGTIDSPSESYKIKFIRNNNISLLS